MELVIETDGTVRCLYDEAFDLSALGSVRIERASHVEPDHQGRWFADLSPVDGPLLGDFSQRREAFGRGSQLADDALAASVVRPLFLEI